MLQNHKKKAYFPLTRILVLIVHSVSFRNHPSLIRSLVFHCSSFITCTYVVGSSSATQFMAHHRRHSVSLGEEIKSSSTIADIRHATASIGRINEMVAEARLSEKNPLGHTASTSSTQSAPIFFSSPTSRRIQSASSSSSSSYRSSIGITALSSSPSTSSKSDSGGKITDKKKEKKKMFACVGVGTQSCKNSRRSPQHPELMKQHLSRERAWWRVSQDSGLIATKLLHSTDKKLNFSRN